MATIPIAKLRLEDLFNRPGISQDGWQAEVIPYQAGVYAAGTGMGCSFKAGTVYTCLLKATTIATTKQLPDMSAVDFAAETSGDMLLVFGKQIQELV